MINTYQTSLAPPPVPPRLNRSHPVLIPGPLPSPGHSRPLIPFLICAVVLHLFLSVGGFIYLYTDKMDKPPSADRKAAFISSEKQGTLYKKAVAGMVVSRQTATKPEAGRLQWDMSHSVRTNVNYHHESWLTVLEPGDYYVYSRVTFTRGDSVRPLASRVQLRESDAGDDETVMQAFCSLESHTARAGVPRMCTATQGGVVRLEKGNQLSVWVQNLAVVDYADGATAFGMYKL